ncbi:MAG TPA: hypothetical protein VFA12_12855 [Stellaceae bacterium]|nr:hypothetical protein [Stellaceae bacterium]
MKTGESAVDMTTRLPSLLRKAAKWMLAACALLALPLLGAGLMLIGYALCDAVRTFGAPALLVILAAAEIAYRRYASRQRAAAG